MKASSTEMPEKAFQVIRDGDRKNCTVEFYDNVKSAPVTDGVTGKQIPSWDFEKYLLNMSYSPGLTAQIETDFATWLKKAKDAELSAEAEKVRNYRDTLLNTADLKFCNSEFWAKMTDEQRQAWTAYKQALRDIPKQGGFPYAINWPVMPPSPVTET